MKPGYEPIPATVRKLREEAGTGSGEIAWMTEAANEIMRLRVLLAVRVDPMLYGDDGELQSHALPFPIDFARDSIGRIEEQLGNRGMAEVVEWVKANPEEAARRGFKFTTEAHRGDSSQ
jgi:hypothetical protein